MALFLLFLILKDKERPAQTNLILYWQNSATVLCTLYLPILGFFKILIIDSPMGSLLN